MPRRTGQDPASNGASRKHGTFPKREYGNTRDSWLGTFLLLLESWGGGRAGEAWAGMRTSNNPSQPAAHPDT